MKFSGQCPVCGAALHLAQLSCPGCKAEFPTDEPLSPYECLAPEYARFLQTFLACKTSWASLTPQPRKNSMSCCCN